MPPSAPPAPPESPFARFLRRLREQEGDDAVERFAADVGSSVHYLLYTVAHGRKAPGARLMRNIVRESAARGRRVTYRELVEWSPGLDTPTRARTAAPRPARRERARGEAV